MMRIAVISDTHDRMPPGLLGRLAEADEIWHLGDVCEPDIVAELAGLGKPVHVVLGNNEWHELWPTELWLERAGNRFHLVHIPPRRAPAGARFVLHGHTHVPRDEMDEAGVRWLNPGALSRPRSGSSVGFAWLTLAEGVEPEWRRVTV
jgi:putative phosphoesterase